MGNPSKKIYTDIHIKGLSLNFAFDIKLITVNWLTSVSIPVISGGVNVT